MANWFLDRLLGGGSVPRRHVLQLTAPCALAWLCQQMELGGGGSGALAGAAGAVHAPCAHSATRHITRC